MEEFNDLMKEVSKHTGHNITDLLGLGYLYSTLYAESSMKLHLPEWTQDIFPNGKLLDATVSFYELFGYDTLNKLVRGMFKSNIVYKCYLQLLRNNSKINILTSKKSLNQEIKA